MDEDPDGDGRLKALLQREDIQQAVRTYTCATEGCRLYTADAVEVPRGRTTLEKAPRPPPAACVFL